jgi:hypothetical protein
MSARKFASLTARLLVRRGQARPSTILRFPTPRPPALRSAPIERVAPPADVSARIPQPGARPERGPQPEPAARPEPEPKRGPVKQAACGDPPPPAAGEKPRRLMVSLTQSEYETLGLIGVKKAVTRHQLLRDAVDEYLALLVEEYAGDCACIHSSCTCRDC